MKNDINIIWDACMLERFVFLYTYLISPPKQNKTVRIYSNLIHIDIIYWFP